MITNIYYFLKKIRKTWLFLILLLWAVFGYLAFQITIQEDVSKALPQNNTLEQYQDFFKKSPLASQVVVALGPAENADQQQELIGRGEEFIAAIDSSVLPLIDSIRYQFGVGNATSSIDFFYENLPYFLDTKTQDSVFSKLDSSAIKNAVGQTLNKLLSPEGFALKSFLLKDPVGLYPLVLRDLSGLKEGGDFKLINNHLFTEDDRFVLILIEPAFPPSESKNNGLLLEALNDAKSEIERQGRIRVHFFGGPVISAKNGERIRKDTKITGTLAVVLILVLLIWYYRKWLTPVLFLLAPLFGMTMALGLVYLLRGEISILTLAAGSIVLGIALDYCFHLFTHLKHSTSVEETLKDISGSLILSCFTTILAFLSLLFLDSQVLTDFGLLASFSLIGTLIFVLLVQPQIVDELGLLHKLQSSTHWIDRVFTASAKWRWPVLIGIVGVTVFLAFFIDEVSFEDDLNKINYFPDELQQAEAIVTSSDTKEKSVFVVSRGATFQDAVDRNKGVSFILDSLQKTGIANSVVSLNDVFPDSKEIRQRAALWNRRVESGRADEIVADFRVFSQQQGMKAESFSEFYNLLQNPVNSQLSYPEDYFQQPLFKNFVLQSEGMVEIVNIININPAFIPMIKTALIGTEALVIDKSQMAASLVKVVKDNFNLILLITSSLVFVTLLLTYGRIELALMTFLPMVISWFWILGICGLFDIKFNFINVLITTFIFGLGDDFCIFVSDGLLSKFKLGKDKLSSYRSSIILSTTTTIIGTGVLIFTKHPALQSIGLLSVIGMLCISFISLTLQPIIFHFAVEKRKKERKPPLTLFIILTTAISFGYFALGCVLVTVLIPIFYVLPIPKKRKRRLFSYIISKFAGSVIYLMVNVRKQVINESGEDFKKPAIIIANHQSFVDILAMLMLNPKVVILTNKWVYNSPLFGWAVRYAGFPTATNDLDDNLPSIEKNLEEGYSIAIFPEGTRSVDGTIKRFHKGAFYLAEKYNLDIVLVLLHGFDYTIRKSDYILLSGHMTIKILNRISPDDQRYGKGYRARTKAISAHMKKEFKKIREAEEDMRYYRDAVVSNYIYKGPVLEWYVKAKMRIEQYFQPFHEYCPQEGTIYDLGCGYGYLSYGLQLAGTSRHIKGVDFDAQKIEVARECWANNKNIDFEVASLAQYRPGPADCYIIKDVLHYLPEAAQIDLLAHCAEYLSTGGRMIVRDGFIENKGHSKTERTEVFSVKLLHFNKAEGELIFPSEQMLYNLAQHFKLTLKRLEPQTKTSNRIFVLEK